MSKIIIETHDLVIKKEKRFLSVFPGFSFAFEVRQSINFGRVLPPFQTKIDLIYHKTFFTKRKKTKKNQVFSQKKQPHQNLLFAFFESHMVSVRLK